MSVDVKGAFYRAAEEQQDEIRAFREVLHQYPELSGQEWGTTERIGNALASFGVAARVSATGTGLIATIGDGDGDAILLRSDVDAMPIDEANDVAYRSRNPGVDHACGHDVTAAGLVYGAKMLKDLHDYKGLQNPVVIVFQPAEEVGTGALAMIREDGVLQNVQAAYGLHCWPRLFVGQYGTREGPAQYGHHKVEMKIYGRRSHTSRPEAGDDLVDLGSKINRQVPRRLYRLYPDKNKRPVMVWGASHFGGDAANVTPSEGYSIGTLRAPGLEGHRNAPDEVTAIVARMAAEHPHVRATVNFSADVPPVINTAWAKAQVETALAAEVGRGAIKQFEGSRGADDMAYYAHGVDGIKGASELHYTQLGVVPRGGGRRKLKAHPDLHTADFDVHPSAAMHAAVYFAAVGAAGLAGRPQRGRGIDGPTRARG
ncbi:amidohydrolase [Streptomycetaceae bacterium NBC_01309]